jgi:LysR family cyn operon transcriptional activator
MEGARPSVPCSRFVNLHQLRYLVATVDEGTMTKAAAACHVAQPALTRAVRALERELGVPLLRRRGRLVELTPDGHRIVESARRALSEIDRLEEIARSRRRERALITTVAATPTLEAELGAGLAPVFWRRHPELALRFVRCGSNEAVAAAVLDGRADVGLCDLPVSPSLTVVPLEEREIVLIAPPGSCLPDPVPIGVLADVPLILPGRTSDRRAAFDRMFATLDIEPLVAFESDERAAWIPAVVVGHGCCVWYRQYGETAARLGAEVRSFDPPLRRGIGIVYRDGTLSPAASAFLAVADERRTTAWHSENVILG